MLQPGLKFLISITLAGLDSLSFCPPFSVYPYSLNDFFSNRYRVLASNRQSVWESSLFSMEDASMSFQIPTCTFVLLLLLLVFNLLYFDVTIVFSPTTQL